MRADYHQFVSEWLKKHQFRVWSYLNKRFSGFQKKQAYAKILDEHPRVSRMLLRSYNRKERELESFLESFFRDHKLCVTVGKQGSGKTMWNKYLISEAMRRGYTVYYRSPDFIPPTEWETLRYRKNFPYWNVYEEALKHRYADKDFKKLTYKDGVNMARDEFRHGRMKGKYMLIHDEVSSDIDAKHFKGKESISNRSIYREIRKLGSSVIVVITDILTNNIPLDLLRNTEVQFFKEARKQDLEFGRTNYYEKVKPFLPRTKKETLVVEGGDRYRFIDLDLRGHQFAWGEIVGEDTRI